MRAVVVPLLILAAALGGCATVSETASRLNPFSSSKSKIPELPPLKATLETRVLWSIDVGKAGDYVFSPAVVGTAVYAAAADGTLLKVENGKVVWRIKAAPALSAGVGSDGKRVLVGTARGEVLAFAAADGKPLWQSRVSSEVLAAPVSGDAGIAVRSGDNRIFLLDAETGASKWFYQRATPPLILRNSAAPVFAENYLFAGFPGGKLVALDVKNGAPLWEGTVALPKGATELERVADIVSPPVFDAGRACAVAYQGRMACFDLTQGGQLLWARDLSSVAGLALDSRHAYVSDDRGWVQALDRASGSSVWKQDALARRGLTAPLVLRGQVVVADSKGLVHFLRRDDGALLARQSVGSSPVLVPPQVLGSNFLIQTTAGGLSLIEAE